MQVRATPDAGDGTFVATISTFNIAYDIGWGWQELILAGAFDESIAAHPVIPVYHQHNWMDGPIGSGKPSADANELTLTGSLYLGMGDLVARVYQAMLDGALEEWSVGYWPQTIISDEDQKMVDQIAKGDLAEGSVCVRGANPETGTVELNSLAWIDGDATAREREVIRIRSLFGGLPDLGSRERAQPEPYEADADELVVCPGCSKRNDSDAGWCDQCGANLHAVGFRPAPYHPDADETAVCGQCGLMNDPDASFCDQCGFDMVDGDAGDGVEGRARRQRAAGHSHGHVHADGTDHAHQHTHNPANYDHDATGTDVTHEHTHEDEPSGPNEDQRAMEARLLSTAWGRELLAKARASAA